MFRYPTPCREAACERMLAGEHVAALAEDLQVFVGTPLRWKTQAMINAGAEAGYEGSRARRAPTREPAY